MQFGKLNKDPLRQLPQRELNISNCFQTHPQINIAEELSLAPRLCATVPIANIFLNEFDYAQQNKVLLFIKRFLNQFVESSINSELVPVWLKGIANNIFQKFKTNFLNYDQINDFLQTREWSTASIKYMAWHPQLFKLAIACSDNAIRVYDREGLQNPKFKNKLQKHIACLAWRPCARDEIAVGCANGIVIWFSYTPEEFMLHFTLLKHKDHYPVTSLEWRSDGLILASASVNDSNILLWNVETEQCSPLRRFNGKNCLIKWAPKSSNLFCSTTEQFFRVWNMKEVYGVERWSLKSGRIQSAAWSPCGQILLFVTDNVPLLFGLQRLAVSPFITVDKPWHAIAVADLNPIFIEGCDFIGGLVQTLAWDQSGSFVAMSFKENSFVALYRTKISGDNFLITQHSYIWESNENYAHFLCFQSNNTFNENVVLTIGWSNGLVKFYSLMEDWHFARLT